MKNNYSIIKWLFPVWIVLLILFLAYYFSAKSFVPNSYYINNFSDFIDYFIHNRKMKSLFPAVCFFVENIFPYLGILYVFIVYSIVLNEYSEHEKKMKKWVLCILMLIPVVNIFVFEKLSKVLSHSIKKSVYLSSVWLGSVVLFFVGVYYMGLVFDERDLFLMKPVQVIIFSAGIIFALCLIKIRNELKKNRRIIQE